MKKILLSALVVASLSSCAFTSNKLKKGESVCPVCKGEKVIDTPKPAEFPGEWVSIFDGKTFEGWRGYNREDVPTLWVVEDGAIKFKGVKQDEKNSSESRGDIIFDKKFDNFEFEFEWKVAKGTNSGVLYLAQEVEGQPIYISAPEYQILDNANHPDAKMGVNNNRQSASLYDMIPAVPQNQKPYGEWNKGKIVVYKGTVIHYQNDVPVVEYHLWTQQWKELLDKSKFSKDKWPLAYDLLLNCGGDERAGFIGLQDHNDEVWFRNLRVKDLNY